VLRLSEELLSGGVLDDECLIVVARGCTQLRELELVQVSSESEEAWLCLPLDSWSFINLLRRSWVEVLCQYVYIRQHLISQNDKHLISTHGST